MKLETKMTLENNNRVCYDVIKEALFPEGCSNLPTKNKMSMETQMSRSIMAIHDSQGIIK